MDRARLAEIRDVAMGILGGESRWASLVTYHLRTLDLMGVDRLSEFADAKGPNGKAIRAVIQAAREVD